MVYCVHAFTILAISKLTLIYLNFVMMAISKNCYVDVVPITNIAFIISSINIPANVYNCSK